MESIKPSQLKEAIRDMVRINEGEKNPRDSLTLMIYGSPGIGKSEIVAQVARETGRELKDVRLSLLDPVDLRGLPGVTEGITTWNPPVFFPHDPKSTGILFLDELTIAPPMLQGAAYQIIRDRASGEYTLPDKWITIGAGNKSTDGAISHRMGTALGSRLVQVELEVDNEEWIEWAIGNGVRAEIMAFLRFRPELLMKFSAKESTFPCPRTWDFVSRILEYQEDPIMRRLLISGSIGVETSAEFMGFLNIWEGLPDVDEILKTGKLSTPTPTEPSVIYALMGCLAHEANVQNFPNVVKYIGGNIGSEFQVVCIRDSVRRNRKLGQTKSYVDWCLENKEIHL